MLVHYSSLLCVSVCVRIIYSVAALFKVGPRVSGRSAAWARSRAESIIFLLLKIIRRKKIILKIKLDGSSSCRESEKEIGVFNSG